MIGSMQRLRCADDVRSHDRRVVMAINACKFQSDLIVGRQFTSTRFVPAQQRFGARTDDKFVGWIIATGGKDYVMLGGQDGALVGTRPDGRNSGRIGLI